MGLPSVSDVTFWLGIVCVVHVLHSFVLAQIDSDYAGQQLEYPTFSDIPKGLSFTCANKIPGYYSDPEARCQVWHWCVPGGRQYSFLCPNGTVFNQAYRVCDWWFNVDCPSTPNLYSINEDLYKDAMGNYIG